VASQVGGVLGVVSVGAVMSWRISASLPDRITQAGVPAPVGDAITTGAESLSQGLVPPGWDAGTVGDPLAFAVSTVSRLTFLDGMSATLLVAAGVSLLGAGLSLWLPKPVPAAEILLRGGEPVSPATR
jgi:hypothetical protein